MIELTFNTEYETIGAEDIIGNVIGSSLIWFNVTKPDSLTIQYENVPQSIIDLAKSLPDWGLIEAIGRQVTLEKYVTEEAPEIFRNAEDKMSAAIEIQTKLQEIINIQL